MAAQPCSYVGVDLGGPSMDMRGSWYPLSLGLAAGVPPQVLNRGNTAGAVYVYWRSPDRVDSAGAYYPYSVPPWTDIVAVVGLLRAPH